VPFRRYHLAALIPVIALIGAPWFANRVEPIILGMPFLLAWIIGWILVTSVCMYVIGKLDDRAS
jgi:hypothetical protein